MFFHFDTKQFCYVFVQLLVPGACYWHIQKHRKKAERTQKIEFDAPVLLPIYFYVIYANIFYILFSFIVYGFVYEHLSYGKLSYKNPIHFDDIASAIIFAGTSHSLALFAIILMISFLTSPSAGKYSLRRSFFQATGFALLYACADILTATMLYPYISLYWTIKAICSGCVLVFLLRTLHYMVKVKNRRWGPWLSAAIHVQCLTWALYFLTLLFAALQLLPDICLTLMYFFAYVIFSFVSPALFYKSLIEDSKYWRKLEKFLLPSHSISLSADLLTNDTLESVGLCGESRGYMNDTLSNFNITLIDFTKLQTNFNILGRGGNAVVYKARYKGTPVAVKELHESAISEETVKEFCREAYLVSKFDDENILRFYGVCVSPPQFLMVFEWCSEGELGEFLISQKQLSSEELLHLAVQAARGLHFFHDRNIIHRDLKPSNFLVDMQSGEACVKLADFGSCRSKHDRIPLLAGISPIYAAPEIRKFVDLRDQRRMKQNLNMPTIHLYSLATDIFPLGWVLWAIFSGHSWKFDLQCNSKRIMTGWLPTMLEFSLEWRQIVKRCWKLNPESRPSIEEVYLSLRQLQGMVARPSFSSKFSQNMSTRTFSPSRSNDLQGITI